MELILAVILFATLVIKVSAKVAVNGIGELANVDE
jgi:hypothetical protein